MGAYLSEPLTNKESEDGEANRLKFGASSMQGWRVSQEDAHNCVGDFDKNTSFFGVYDGHGGSEVAIYLARHLPEFLQKSAEYVNGGDLSKALHNTYLSIDESIKTKEALEEIQLIAKGKNSESQLDEISGADYEDENVGELYEEATMPLEALVKKYQAEHGTSVPETNKDDRPCSSRSILSPKLPTRTAASAREAAQGSSGSTNGAQASEANANENGDAKVADPNAEGDAPTIAELISSSDEKTTPEGEAKVEHKNGEAESQEAIKNEMNVKGGPQQSAMEIIAELKEKQQSNGDHDPEADSTTPKASAKSESDDSAPKAGSTNAENSDPKASEEKPASASAPSFSPSASAMLGRIKRQVYQSLILPESDSDASEEDEDESFHVPGMHLDDDDDDSSAEEEMNSESSEEDDDGEEGMGAEDESDEDEDEDDDFLNDTQEPGFDSGSTAVCALLRWEGNLLHLWVANAGDSRCVISRDGKALDMSKDHKPEEDVEARRIVAAGGKVTADGRVNGGLNLSRALGDHSYKQNKNLTPEEQMITPVPDIEHIVMDPKAEDDFIVLACDGIWNSMTSQQVVDFVSSRLTPEAKLSEICEQLFDACLATDTTGDGTGCDNMTAVIIRVEKPKTGKRELSFTGEEEEGEGTKEEKRLKLDATDTTEEKVEAKTEATQETNTEVPA